MGARQHTSLRCIQCCAKICLTITIWSLALFLTLTQSTNENVPLESLVHIASVGVNSTIWVKPPSTPITLTGPAVALRPSAELDTCSSEADWSSQSCSPARNESTGRRRALCFEAKRSSLYWCRRNRTSCSNPHHTMQSRLCIGRPLQQLKMSQRLLDNSSGSLWISSGPQSITTVEDVVKPRNTSNIRQRRSTSTAQQRQALWRTARKESVQGFKIV